MGLPLELVFWRYDLRSFRFFLCVSNKMKHIIGILFAGDYANISEFL